MSALEKQLSGNRNSLLVDSEPGADRRFFRPWGWLLRWCASRKGSSLLWLACATSLGVAAVDFYTGPLIAFSIFYLPPIMLVSWFVGRRAGLALAVFCALAWLLADEFTSHSPLLWIPLWNACVRLAFFLLVVVLQAELRNLHDHLQKQAYRESAERAMVETTEHEQQRIARTLHDGLGAHLAGLALQAKMLAHSLAEERSAHVSEADRFISTLNDAVRQTRDLAHMLAPDATSNHRLCAVLSALAEEAHTLLN
jgi:signal transduction histidine kinase